MRHSLMVIAFAVLVMAAPAHAQDTPFVGQIDIVGFNFAPAGWHICDGSLMAISEDEALFSLIGTTYGGDGQNTFALPDLRGRMAIHQGTSNTGYSYVLGQMAGEETVTLTINQIPAHTHVAMGSSAAADSLGPASNEWGKTAVLLYSSTGSPQAMKTGAVGMAGGGQAHDNMPPYLVLNFIISLFGVYPSPT
ncbi:MAG TPA: tail fiber protein [Candidatus Acidoferrum sp.]|nr:tail fiber protein [Candidatus Acidoferrum sp.]